MRSRTRSLAALGLSLCLGAALGLPSTAAADPRDGRGWRSERHDDRDGHHDRGRHGDRDRRGHDGWDRRGHAYGWGHGGYDHHRHAAHRQRHGHGRYAYQPRGYGYGGWRPFWLFGR